jgi:ribosomal protein L37AE/L43A
MFLQESKETNTFTKKSKFGKLAEYTRTKTLTHWQCDHCGNKFTKVRNGKYNPVAKSYCKSCVNQIGINKLASLAGYASKVKNQFEPNLGKVIIGKEGYPEVYIGKSYPYRPGGYRSIREHVYVMELHLNRRLEKDDVVHHIDGDKTNNKLDNLFLTTTAEHNKLHGCSEKLIFELVKKGIVIFNRETARYELHETKIY